ncbi:GtrA family protein [Variovorax sp.]|uniref:GtrA family protein n=1 Tax=Variovorax sp. TaxID=1871043 RepID=UPI002D447857|nr:GtrA family protein [Variovorax sp.]HYP83633.1 GtrA family protein [Variovorax sp.]
MKGRVESIRQLLSYAAVGVVNTLVGYGIIFASMYLLHMGPVASNVLGYAVGVVVSYFLNRRFTFRSSRAARTEFLRFVSVVLLAWLANLAVLVFLIRHMHVHEGLAQVPAGVVYLAISFLLSKFFVFASRDSRASRG